MTQPERDDEFEAFLKRRTVLPHGMDDGLEPPGALDAVILRKAREAIDAQTQSQRAPRWAKPLAIAATILLCLSVVLNISLNTHRPEVDQQRTTAAVADKAEAEAPGDAVGPSVAANDTFSGGINTAAPRQAPNGAPAAADRAGSDAGANAAADRALAKGATGAVADRTLANVATGASVDRTVAGAAASGAARQAASPPALARDDNAERRREKAGSTTLSDVTASRDANLAYVRPPALSDTEPLAAPAPAPIEPQASVPALTAAARPLAPPVTPPTTGGATASAPSAATEMANTAAPAPSAVAPSPPPAPSQAESSTIEEVVTTSQRAAPKRKSNADAAASHPKDPKIWLRQIDALRAQGKTVQADAEMQRFRAAFPSYPADPTTPASPAPSDLPK